MYYSFSIFILFYFAIILSCLGYGIFISQKLENYLKIECLGFKGLIGIFFLLIYSYISHFIIPHGLLHNSILMLIGLLFFTYYAINPKFRGMKILFFTFSILFLSFLIFNLVSLSLLLKTLTFILSILLIFLFLLIFIF